MSNSLEYEFPLNEKIRTLLRLEYLFKRFRSCLNETSSFSAESALITLIDIHQLLEYSAVDKILLEEQLKYHRHLERLLQTPNIDKVALENILSQLKVSINTLENFNFHQIQFIRSALFKSCENRMALQGGLMSFDAPLLHYWLNQSQTIRQELLEGWALELQALEESNLLLLHLIRQCDYPQSMLAKYGQFKKSLKNQHNPQLIKVSFDAALKVYPKFSGDQHIVHISFYDENYDIHTRKTTHQDIHFDMTLCNLS